MSENKEIVCPICQGKNVDDYKEKVIVLRMDFYNEKVSNNNTADLFFCCDCYKYFVANVDF